MMIDVDPDFRAPDGFACFAETILRGGVERDGDIEIFRFAGGGMKRFAARKEADISRAGHLRSRPSRLCPVSGARSASRDLAAERVAIGPNMAEDGKALMRAQGRRDFRESASF